MQYIRWRNSHFRKKPRHCRSFCCSWVPEASAFSDSLRCRTSPMPGGLRGPAGTVAAPSRRRRRSLEDGLRSWQSHTQRLEDLWHRGRPSRFPARAEEGVARSSVVSKACGSGGDVRVLEADVRLLYGWPKWRLSKTRARKLESRNSSIRCTLLLVQCVASVTCTGCSLVQSG